MMSQSSKGDAHRVSQLTIDTLLPEQLEQSDCITELQLERDTYRVLFLNALRLLHDEFLKTNRLSKRLMEQCRALREARNGIHGRDTTLPTQVSTPSPDRRK